MRMTFLGLATLAVLAQGPQAPSLPASPLSAEQKALHLLNRLAYGPRPGDVERLAQGGDPALKAWILAQLQPGSDPALAARLKTYTTLELSIPELQKAYPRPEALAKQEGLSAEAAKARRAEVPREQRPVHIEEELASAKLFRAVNAQRQLEEVLVDFWFNHFNVDWTKGECKWFVPDYERNAIRPFVFGRFRDLLGATAQHPAMLFYLDNWLSTREGFDPSQYDRMGGNRQARAEARMLRDRNRESAGLPPAMPSADQVAAAHAKPPARKMGLNENYARELMELHTLGVDGGYTQADVREVARCFTGWTLDQPRQAATPRFRPVAHDAGDKVVLGKAITAGGVKDGEAVLDLLAAHPATARFIATKLCRRFVADQPPSALVERVAQVFLSSGGDLRKTYAAVFFSPEFWSAEAHLAKVKTPFEFMASTLRGLDATLEDPLPLIAQLNRMGQPPYRCAPPTGWKDTAEAWVSTGALVNRVQLGMALGRQQVKAVSWDREDLRSAVRGAPPEEALDRLGRLLLHRPLSEATRSALLKELQGEEPRMPDGEIRPLNRAKLVGLLLGSPEFQRR
ncbi:MAG TPA: DUF1800 domain-containing protein [Holophagaceae bacterium]|nr:DUF1800 domain-containing protein [Holophagaceae bacterium]